MVPAEETMDETISRIVSQYSPMLLRLAYARLGSAADAEDAVQETFLQLVSLRPNFRDAEHEKAWLIRTTLCRASDMPRRTGGPCLWKRRPWLLRRRRKTANCWRPFGLFLKNMPRQSIFITMKDIPSKKSPSCWAPQPPLSAPAWPAAGRGYGRC